MPFQMYEKVLASTWSTRPIEAILADIAQPKPDGLEAEVVEIELKIAEGDQLARARKYQPALDKYKAARATIYKILYPDFNVLTYLLERHDMVLPLDAEIEASLLQATVKIVDVNRPKKVDAGPSLGIAAPKMSDELLVHTRTGYLEANDDEATIQLASEQAVQLLYGGKPAAAVALLEGALEMITQARVDPSLLGALELNLAAAQLQTGDLEASGKRAARAQRAFKSADDSIGQAQAAHLRGVVLTEQGDAQRAGRFLKQAAELLPGQPADTDNGTGRSGRPSVGPNVDVGGRPNLTLRPAVSLGPIATNPARSVRPARLTRDVTRAEATLVASREVKSLDPILKMDASTITFRLPGRDEAWGALPVSSAADRDRVGKAWEVAVNAGSGTVTFPVGGSVTIEPAAVVAKLYEPRRTAALIAALELNLTSVSTTTFYLTHLYAYGLLVRIGDMFHQLGRYRQAEQNYQLAAKYSHLNREVEASRLWTRLARNALLWGHSLYKKERTADARTQYEKLITTDGQVPAGFLYDTNALGVPADEARTLIAAFNDRPLPEVNWEISIYVLTAFEYLQQIFDNLDYYGLALSPIHTFEYLQSIAKGFALEAVQAEREFVTFKMREEAEAASRRDLETTKAMADAEADIRFQNWQGAIQDESAARNARDLAQRRHANAIDQRNKYAASSASQIWAQAAATALGAGEDAYYGEISELADRLARGETISGAFGKIAAAEILYGARKTRDYELARMQDNIDELARTINVAQDQLDAAARRTVAAELSYQAARSRAQMADSALDAFDDEFFTPETWGKMADVLRDISRSYLFRAIRTAKLMERAYNFENDTSLSVIKSEYGHGLANTDPGNDNRLLGGDTLLRDIDGFTYRAVTTKTRKSSPIKDVISISTEYPAQFQQFLETGHLGVETDLYEFDRRHPGYFAQRIEAVEVQFIGALPEGGPRGTLSLGGVTRFRRQNGAVGERVHQIDTMAISDFLTRQDAFLYIAETGVRGLFQGFGVGATWELHLPRRSNAFDLHRIFDVQLVVYYRATFDPALRTTILSTPPRPGELAASSTFSVRHAFPDSWYRFYAQAETTVALSRFQFPANQQNFAINSAQVRVVTAEGVSPEAIDLRMVGPNGVDAVVATDAVGMISTDDGALAGLIDADPVADWSISVVGGAPVTDGGIVVPDHIYNMQLGLDYRFDYLSEAV